MPRRGAVGKTMLNNKSNSKIVIRPYSKPPSLPVDYYNKTVQHLLQGTLELLQQQWATASSQQSQSLQQPTSHNDSKTLSSLQTSYTAVVTLVRHQYGPQLYADWMKSLQQAVQTVLPLNQQQQQPQTLLRSIPTSYAVFLDYLQVCKHVFSALDRSHVWTTESNKAVPTGSSTGQTMWMAGLAQFRARMQELNQQDALYQEWKIALLKDWHNTNENNERGHLQAVWYMWQDLGLVGTATSPLPLQQDLQEHWQKCCQEQWMAVVDENPATAAVQFLSKCMQYHDHVIYWRPWLPVLWLWHILDQHLVLPVLNDKHLLNPTYLHPLLQRAQQEFVAVGLTSKLPPSRQQQPQQRASPIQQLWMLAGRLTNGQQSVATAICHFAKTQGLQRLESPQDSPSGSNGTTAVAELLTLQESLTAMVQALQPAGPDLIAFKAVWEEVVNAKSSLAEPLAKFLDQLLRSHKKMDVYASRSTPRASAVTSSTATSTAPPDEWLQRIISGLFVPLQAKDVFEAFYKRDLAKRLLWNRVVNMDVEKQVCSLLKAECGAGYTSKMEGMFQDIDLSRESMLLYKQAAATDPAIAAMSVEMEVQILTTGYWPVYPQYPNLNLPTQLQTLQEHYDSHYKKKCQGRRVTWQYALGHTVVKANGFSKQYELLVSLCQALVLLQFRDSDSKWNIRGLMQAVGLEDRDEMERILQSLALGKEGTRILRKLDYDTEPGKKKKIRMAVDDRDEFTIQQSFSSNQRRIRITNIMMKETKEERDKTVEAVSRDRLYLIDAALVRTMKARKSILHQNLIPQVLEQLKFPAQASDVKKRIESLIEREYMERDSEDRNRYNYMA